MLMIVPTLPFPINKKEEGGGDSLAMDVVVVKERDAHVSLF
jgi:hypothetical protein